MHPQSLRRGWCPTAALAMEAADGWLLRVRPSTTRLPARDLRCLARIAAEHGNGAVVITRRAKLELRGIRDADAAARALRDTGLAPADPDLEARPDVIASPASDLDEHATADVGPIARALERELAAWPVSRELPAKTAVVVDGGGRAHVGSSAADVRFDAIRRDGGVVYRVAVAGTGASAAPIGICAAEAVPRVALALLERFHALRLGREDRIWRMRHALDWIEPCDFAAAVEESMAPCSDEPLPAADRGSVLGPAVGWYGVAFAFGRLDGAALQALAETTERHAQGDVRVLPTRALLVSGASAEAAAPLREVGAIDRADDPRLRVEACSGLGGCARATTHTRSDALTLAERLPALLGRDTGCLVHVSGCSKGCAHPGAAPVTLTGRDGRYDLCVAAAPGDEPLWAGLDTEAAVARLAALERVLACARPADESPAAALARYERGQLRERVEQELAGG